jgi:two-component system, LytTR family, sensor kinase
MTARTRRLFIGLWALLTLIGLARAFQHYYIVDAFEPVQFGLWWHVPFNLFLWWSWLLFIPIISRIAQFEVGKNQALLASLVAYLLAPLVIVILRQALASIIISVVLVGYKTIEELLVRRLLGNFWVWLDILVYFLILLSIQMVYFRRRDEATSTKLAQLQKQLAHSRLSALESQLRPHFLFNTLNTLSTLLLRRDSPEALRMLALLRDFLGITLERNARHGIPLKEEMWFIRHYLEIERVRFKDKLSVAIDIPTTTEEAIVPRFLLQPIVENAIRHAVEPSRGQGTISIAAAADAAALRLVVEDSGSDTVPGKKKQKEGIGLKLTQQRLESMYGGQYELTFGRTAAAGYRVAITIPFAVAMEGDVEK